jgi:hypothetical protein
VFGEQEQAVVQFPPMPPTPGEQRIVARVFSRFPEANRDDILRFIMQRFPREIYEFRALSMHDEEGAVQFLSELVVRSLRLLDTGKRDPSLLELILEMESLEERAESQASEILWLKGAGREKAVKTLTETVDELVGVKLRIKEFEVNQVERDLEGLKSLLRRMKRSRRAMVSRRVFELTGTSAAGTL